jgi:hypothetical protein
MINEIDERGELHYDQLEPNLHPLLNNLMILTTESRDGLGR